MHLLNTDTVAQVHEKLKNAFNENLSASLSPSKNTEMISLRCCVGRYLAEEIKTDTDVPGFRRSVVDGYAVIAADTFGASESIPAFLEVIGQVEMGKPSAITLEKGLAAYVPTGGMVPRGADSMVMIEYTESFSSSASANETSPGTIAVYKPAAPGGHIMNIGDDFKKEQIIFKIGHRVRISDIGMLAACGRNKLSVFLKPKVAVISTGDEIIDISKIPEVGQVRDINSYAIAAFAEKTGAEITGIDVIKDSFENLQIAAKEKLFENDILLLSGGSSAGVKDMTADLIKSLGDPGVLTHGIAIKPGKPTIIGLTSFSGKPVLTVGLPGHPMSAIIVYKTVIEPFIKEHYFKNNEPDLSVKAILTENIHAGEGKETYQLVTLENLLGNENLQKSGFYDLKNISFEASCSKAAVPIHAKSGSIAQLATANGFIKISSLKEGLSCGDTVDVILL